MDMNTMIKNALDKSYNEGFMDGTDEAIKFCALEMGKIIIRMYSSMKIDHVIFNDPATIVFWQDGTKTVVKADQEKFDPEKGLAMAISKKAMGNSSSYYEVFKQFCPEEEVTN